MLRHTISIVFLTIGIKESLGKIGKPNVCSTWAGYNNMTTSPDCWYSPYVKAGTPDCIEMQGYNYQEYEVHTEDGFTLSLFRIVKKESDPNDKPPVLMMHGMGTESTCWVALANKSLAFSLTEDDYDVWIGNWRGNKYGRKHNKYDFQTNLEFWDFTIDDMAKYDLPAILEVVRNNTNPDSKIIYIGHSMGTTVVFMYASEQQKKAEENFVAIIAVSPSAYLKDMTYLRLIIPVFYPVSQSLEKTYSRLNLNNILIHPRLASGLSNFCSGSTARIRFCFSISQIMFGFDEEQFSPEDFPVLLSFGNSGVGSKCVTQYLQMAGSNKFQHYDHGPVENKRLYNSSTPKEYHLSAITVPVHLFSGRSDALTTYKNVHRIHNDLTCEKSLTMISEDNSYHFNHIDFLVAKDIRKMFIKPLMQLLNEKLLNNRIK